MLTAIRIRFQTIKWPRKTNVQFFLCRLTLILFLTQYVCKYLLKKLNMIFTLLNQYLGTF